MIQSRHVAVAAIGLSFLPACAAPRATGDAARSPAQGALHPTASAMTVGSAAEAARLRALVAADQRAASAALEQGLARGLGGLLSADAVLLVGGMPIVRGRDQARRVLGQADSSEGFRLEWQSLQGILAPDGSHGVTYGVAMANQPAGRAGAPAGAAAPTLGRVAIYWSRTSADGWEARAVAFLTPWPEPRVDGRQSVTASERVLAVRPPRSDAMWRTDSLFSSMSKREGAGRAFRAFAAPNAVLLFARGPIAIGPAQIEAAIDGALANVEATWSPCLAVLNDAGDFGFTVGDAEFSVASAAGPAERAYSKYLTVWQRAEGGEWKYVFDGGNARRNPSRGGSDAGAGACGQ